MSHTCLKQELFNMFPEDSALCKLSIHPKLKNSDSWYDIGTCHIGGGSRALSTGYAAASASKV